MTTVDDICLGTVKLGIPDYGFSSNLSETDFDAIEFLSQANKLGINRFDTAPRYGNSEAILGQYIADAHERPFVSSKIDHLLPANPRTPDIMVESVQNSLSKLRLSYLDVCYLHQNELEIITDPYVHIGFDQLKKMGLIEHSGVSLYSFDECSYAVESLKFDFVQVPVNICDISFYLKWVQPFASQVQFVARSLLLQGVLTNVDQISSRIKQSQEIKDYLDKINIIVSDSGISVLEMALITIFSFCEFDHFIIGTTSLSNLQKNISCTKYQILDSQIEQLAILGSSRKYWSNPRNWL